MIYKWLTILFLLALCSFISYSQGNKTIKTSRSSEQQPDKEKYVKEQALLLLKTILLNSKSIKNSRQRTDSIAEASATLRDYDKSFAEESLLNFIPPTINIIIDFDYSKQSEVLNC